MEKISKNESGLTLVEILAALVILGIVLVSFMSFFTQSAKFTVHNGEKLTAVQVAEDVVAEVREAKYKEEVNFKRNDFNINIKIYNGPVNLMKAVITVKSPPNNGVSEPEFITEMYFKITP